MELRRKVFSSDPTTVEDIDKELDSLSSKQKTAGAVGKYGYTGFGAAAGALAGNSIGKRASRGAKKAIGKRYAPLAIGAGLGALVARKLGKRETGNYINAVEDRKNHLQQLRSDLEKGKSPDYKSDKAQTEYINELDSWKKGYKKNRYGSSGANALGGVLAGGTLGAVASGKASHALGGATIGALAGGALGKINSAINKRRLKKNIKKQKESFAQASTDERARMIQNLHETSPEQVALMKSGMRKIQ